MKLEARMRSGALSKGKTRFLSQKPKNANRAPRDTKWRSLASFKERHIIPKNATIIQRAPIVCVWRSSGALKARKDRPMDDNNPYLRMPQDRVRSDALTGVKLAREAYRERDPVRADIDLGPVVLPSEQAEHRRRVMAAIAGYQRSRPQRAARSSI